MQVPRPLLGQGPVHRGCFAFQGPHLQRGPVHAPPVHIPMAEQTPQHAPRVLRVCTASAVAHRRPDQVRVLPGSIAFLEQGPRLGLDFALREPTLEEVHRAPRASRAPLARFALRAPPRRAALGPGREWKHAMMATKWVVMVALQRAL